MIESPLDCRCQVPILTGTIPAHPHMLMLIFNETHHVTFQCLMISTCYKCAVSSSWKAQTCQNYQMISWWKYARVTCGCVTADRPLESHLTTNNPPAPVSVWTQRGCQRNFTILLLTHSHFMLIRILGQLSTSFVGKCPDFWWTDNVKMAI